MMSCLNHRSLEKASVSLYNLPSELLSVFFKSKYNVLKIGDFVNIKLRILIED